MSTGTNENAFPYHEPSINTILILTSFLLLLNIINHIMDKVTYVGLLGQILLGIAFGTPGGKLLNSSSEEVIVNLGYLGLLILVYEGGLTTSFQSLRANLVLSLCVAITGISVPIGFSFVLVIIANASPLQAFAAGAALCSTSLGTTFTVLQTSGLNVTRLGVVLTLAAMIDDVIGLVMVQVITNLGQGSGLLSAATIIRPVFVSIGFGVAIVVICRFVVLPLTKVFNNQRRQLFSEWSLRVSKKEHISFIVHTLILVGMITGATYAGTSGLFAAYLAGAAINWWDNDVPHTSTETSTVKTGKKLKEKHKTVSKTQPVQAPNAGTILSDQCHDQADTQQVTEIAQHDFSARESTGDDEASGIRVFETFYHQPLQRILKPFFFASIGFSIPITQMFTGRIFWKGIVYTALMFIGKLICGVWLLRITVPNFARWMRYFKRSSKYDPTPVAQPTESSNLTLSEGQNESSTSFRPAANSSAKLHPAARPSHSISSPAKPISIYPSLMLGCAMVARGEIGFLISSLAQSNGIFGESRDNPLFLIVTWAIMLCTILGPVIVGLMVKRVHRLDGVAKGTGKRNLLGVWGVT